MKINQNISGLNTLNVLKANNGKLSDSLEKLSSGYKINRSADDAAGLAISESMRSRITEIARCQQNVVEGIAVTDTADGALSEINSMLIRAHELCIEAANGVYTDTERDAISKEISQIFDEVDRITAYTKYNGIPLFRGKITHEIDEIEDPVVSRTYVDKFTPVADLATWGDMPFDAAADFDPAEMAKAATVTLTLDDGVDPANASTLSGKSVSFKFSSGASKTYVFSDPNNPALIPSGATKIDVSEVETVASALQEVVDRCTELDAVSVDGNKVTFTAKMQSYNETVNADGMSSISTVANGSGIDGNSYQVISVEGNSLGAVDTLPNTPVYETEGTNSFKLCGKNNSGDMLTATEVETLKGASLKVAGENIQLSSVIGNNTTMSVSAFGQALAKRISSLTALSATYDSATNKLTINKSNLSDATNPYVVIQENTKKISDGTASHSVDKNSTGLIIDRDDMVQPSLEKAAVAAFTFSAPTSLPLSFKAGGTSYYYYKPSSDFPPDGYYLDTNNNTVVHFDNLNDAFVDALDKIETALKSEYGSGKVQRDGNKMIVTGKSYGTPISSDTLKTYTSFITGKKDPTSAEYAPPMLKISSKHFAHNVSTTIKIPDDVSELIGKGFNFNPIGAVNDWQGIRFEFTNGANSGKLGTFTDIDITGCSSAADVLEKMKMEPDLRYYSFAEEPAGHIKISYAVSTNGNNAAVMDGYTDKDGIFTNAGAPDLTENFSGGTVVNHQNKEIDFSSITDENLNDLLGKGFRINCATCSGEYINVVFCWENNGKMPASFKVIDPDTNTERTIHNVAVELSKVNNGSEIVKNIVEQVRPQLNHFTDVAVGDPPTKLVAFDKRPGYIGGDPDVLGSVESGLVANFTYECEVTEIHASEVYGDDWLKQSGPRTAYCAMDIFVGSTPNPEWITIRLPYLDLETLNLRPPEVDLGGDDSPYDWLNRIDAANDIIIASRARIGADYNRLEHCGDALASSHELATDSESRIRDLDMAKEHANMIRLNVQMQVGQSMLVQSNMNQQQVLELLR